MRPQLSSASRPSSSRLGLLCAGLLLLLLTALVRLQGAPPRAENRASSPPFPANLKAHNPAGIVLLPHPPGVVGWISGPDRHVGKKVTVKGGPQDTQVTVEAGGVFAYRLQVERPTRLSFTLGDLISEIELQPQEKLPRSVFFVLDRSVYRPRQTLRFAGFLRGLNSKGDFVPVKGEVELLLTHANKKTVARLRRSADAMGRISGQYTFTASDPLGPYTLSVPGHVGTAELSLAEYRKTPMRLTIQCQRQGSELQLRFQARDYLGQAVPGGKVQLTAQVLSEPARPPRPPLDGKEFVYAGQGPPTLRLEDLGVEEGLLAQLGSERESILGLEGDAPRVVKEIRGETKIDRRGEGTYALTLQRKWLEQRHVLAVKAVLIDATGREVRKSQTLAIGEEEDGLHLSLPRTHFFANEPIRVALQGKDGGKVKGRASLVVLKLSARLPAAAVPTVGVGMVGFGSGMMGMMGVGPYGGPPTPPKRLERDDWLQRSLFTVEPF